jgi:nicotinamide riboside transporter PnuC
VGAPHEYVNVIAGIVGLVCAIFLAAGDEVRVIT